VCDPSFNLPQSILVQGTNQMAHLYTCSIVCAGNVRMEEASEHRQGNEAAANIPKLHADLGWSTQMSTNRNHP